ncbi:MAG: biopolymer transporter ExbD [Chitinophagaceae bacterium]|nr:MAG: biopolymer transporter ExbD [Chitinophagaceae bacterium]
MATLNVPQSGKAVRGSTRKPIPAVDLTAMVDLAFLLITFFMLTTSLSKMSAMEIAKPVPKDHPIVQQAWPASQTMTVLLGKNNQIAHYLGEASKNPISITNLSGIRKVILNNKKVVADTHENKKDKDLYVIIKPTSTSVYKNFVDVVDEMSINKINTYAIDDKYLLDEEVSFMKSKGI